METAIIRISPEVYEALIAEAEQFDGQLEGERREDGWYDVPLSHETIARLDQIDEDPDQAARAARLDEGSVISSGQLSAVSRQ